MIEIRNVLCPVDFSPMAYRNVKMGVEVCRRVNSRLVLHHNLDSRPPGFLSVNWMWSEEHEAAAEERKRAVPEKMEELFAQIPEGIEHEAKLTQGPLDSSLLHLAEDLPADLIIMATHGKSDSEHESLTERIIIQAPCSVLTIGESYVPENVFGQELPRPPEQQCFLIPVDFTPRARAVLEFAFALGEVMPHKLVMLNVLRDAVAGVNTAQTDREVEKVRERLQALIPESLAHKTSVMVKVGPAADEILHAAEETDPLCIVMAAHGKTLLKKFLFGHTTVSILHGANCPVWFVPAAVQKSLTRAEFSTLG